MMRLFCFPFLVLLFVGCSGASSPVEDRVISVRDTVYLPAETPVVVGMQADKMNVVYLGLENPVSVVVNGISPWDISVSASQGKLRGNAGAYVFSDAEKIGPVTFTVSGPEGVIGTFDFRVKRIPDPMAKLGGKSEGKIRSQDLIAQKGIYALMTFNDIDGTCPILNFTTTRITTTGERFIEVNEGGRFEPATRKLIDACSPGDIYLFTQIVAKCPGDRVGRSLPPVVFSVE